MNNRIFKRILAALLAFVMILNSCPELLVKAEEAYQQVVAYDIEEVKQQLSKGNNDQTGTVTFPLETVSMNLGEELIFHVLRQGDTSKAQTVTLATFDMTAGYGNDYEIMVDGAVINGEARVIVNGKNITYDVYLDQNGQAITEEDEYQQNNTQEYSQEEIKKMEEARDKVVSSEFEVTFAEGEQIKELRIRAKRPMKTTVNKQFQLIISEYPEGLEEGESNAVMVSLCETREVKESDISIVKRSIDVKDGYVTAIVKRKGNTEGYESYTLSSEDGTAVNGEDYILTSSQLIFTPGVSRQRIHIPLVTSEKTETKTFTLKAGESEEAVTYQTTLTSTSAFKESREYINVPWDTFTVQGNNLGAYEFYRENENDRYIFAADSGIGDGDCRTLSIRSCEKYNFTGIKGIRFSGSYAIGTVAGDFLNIYASNEDFYNNTAKLSSVDTQNYGGRYGVLDLDGQALLTSDVDRKGEYYVYVTMQQHNVLGGHIEYNLYDQEFDGGKKGHLALMKEDYTLEILGPDSLGSTVPAGDIRLTLNTDSSVSGESVKAYRDEHFTFSYELLDEGSYFAGYEIIDVNDNVIFSKETTDPIFSLTSELIEICEGRIYEDTLRIRPVFARKIATMTVGSQDFEKLEMTGLSVNMDQENGKAVYFDNGEIITTVTWNVGTYESGSTISFKADDNPEYNGEYRFTAYKILEGNEESLEGVNPLYYMGNELDFTVEYAYYQVVPTISNIKAPFYLNVKGANHGTFFGEPEGQSQDTYTMMEYDGKYEPTDIAIFQAIPDDGYRAKWSYRDVTSGEKKVYYGNTFYYRVQFPSLTTDNYVTLEFEENSNQERYTVAANVYMQAGDVLHASANQDLYHPVESCTVKMGMFSGQTDDTGKVVLEGKTEGVIGSKDEVHTALLFVNNRYYIEEVDFSKAENNIVCQEIKLPYYAVGPYVSSVRYVDSEGNSQNGDTIFLDSEMDSCIIAATVENKNKEITDVIFKVKDKTGAQKGEGFKAERIGDEYCWSALLGSIAEEGDQIWVELISTTYNSDGTISKQTSYGEVNTGYEIVIAEYLEVSYIPDIGIDEFREDNLRKENLRGISFDATDVFNFFLQGLGFLNSVKGTTLVFNTSNAGNITYLNFGVNFSTMSKANFPPEFHRTHVDDWKKYVGVAVSAFGEDSDARKQARQVLKKNSFVISVPVYGQLALYQTTKEEAGKSKLVVVGGGVTFGVNGSYVFTYPFPIWAGIPAFVTLSFKMEMVDTIQIGPKTEEGYVSLRYMSDPDLSSIGIGNTLSVPFTLSGMSGVGVNGVASFQLGISGKYKTDFVDFKYGRATFTGSGDFRAELFLVGRTFSLANRTVQVFNNVPQDRKSESASSMTDVSIYEEKLDEMVFKNPGDYLQKLNLNGSGTLIEDAYEFSRPNVYAMGNNKYMLIATVDSKFVTGYEEEGKAVLGMAVYDGNKGEYIQSADGKIFRSIAPDITEENSVNFNPSVTALSDGRFLITWNTVFHDPDEKITLRNVRSVIRTAILDVEDMDNIAYKSLVLEDENGENLHTGIIENIVYDEKNEEVIMMYRAMNFGNLNENSTILDYAKLGSKLCVTSIKTDKESQKDNQTTWENTIVLAEGGNGKAIKSTDMAMMNDVPIITYHVIEDEDASLFLEGGTETNHIYLTSLKHKGSGYEIDFNEQLKLEETKYHAEPQLASGTAAGKEVDLIMWKQEDRIATANVLDIMDGSIYEGNADASGLSVVNSEITQMMENIKVFTGEDGKIYSSWTERTENGTKMMMSVLEEHGDSVSWGQGSEVFVTDSENYIMNYTPVVNEDGNLVTVYRQTNLSDESGYSEIVLKDEILIDQLEVNTKLYVSNRYPKEGETITIKARVQNKGVGLAKGKTLALNVDGKSTGITAEVPELASGEEACVEFEYTVPKEVTQNGAVFSAGSARGTVYSSAHLLIESMDFEELNLAQEGEASDYKFTVQVSNQGNNVAQNITVVASYLTTTSDEEGVDHTTEQILGQGKIASIRPNAMMSTKFDVTIPSEMFQTSDIFRLAPVAVAIYENYGTEDQELLDLVEDYAEATLIPEAEEITVEGTMTVGIGQKRDVYASVNPLEAQMYAGLEYQISDESIASVDANGIITGLKEGTCDVTVSAQNGVEAILKLTVQKEAVEDDDTTNPDLPEEDGPIKDDSGRFDPEDDADKGDVENISGMTAGTATGDQAMTILLGMLFVMSVTVIAVILYQRRKYYL